MAGLNSLACYGITEAELAVRPADPPPSYPLRHSPPFLSLVQALPLPSFAGIAPDCASGLGGQHMKPPTCQALTVAMAAHLTSQAWSALYGYATTTQYNTTLE